MKGIKKGALLALVVLVGLLLIGSVRGIGFLFFGLRWGILLLMVILLRLLLRKPKEEQRKSSDISKIALKDMKGWQ